MNAITNILIRTVIENFHLPGEHEQQNHAGDDAARREKIYNTRVRKEHIPDVVYVGTSAGFYNGFGGKRGIKEVGIDPKYKSQFRGQQNKRDRVFVSTNRSRASAYANLYDDPVVVKISTRALDKNKFFMDPDDVPANEYDNAPVQIAYRGKIPKNAIIGKL